MKRSLISLIFLLICSVVTAAQNSSLRFSPNNIPMPTRQVASTTNIFAHPGMINSYPNSLGLTIGLKKKRSRRVITTEPIIILEPSLRDKPHIE
ncbi:MAG: hypothetical protein AB1489_10115 [Acidobacteriota bacterium]